MGKNLVQTKLFPEHGEKPKVKPGPDSGMGEKPWELILLDIVSGLEDPSFENILSEAVSRKIGRRDALKLLEKLRLEGIVYCPKHGEYKVV